MKQSKHSSKKGLGHCGFGYDVIAEEEKNLDSIFALPELQYTTVGQKVNINDGHYDWEDRLYVVENGTLVSVFNNQVDENQLSFFEDLTKC